MNKKHIIIGLVLVAIVASGVLINYYRPEITEEPKRIFVCEDPIYYSWIFDSENFSVIGAEMINITECNIYETYLINTDWNGVFCEEDTAFSLGSMEAFCIINGELEEKYIYKEVFCECVMPNE